MESAQKKLTVHVNYSQPKYFSYDTDLKKNDVQNMKWEDYSYFFIATTGQSTLTFMSSIPGAFGPVLDNVVINEIRLSSEDQCKSNGWSNYRIFNNQNECLSFMISNH